MRCRNDSHQGNGTVRYATEQQSMPSSRPNVTETWWRGSGQGVFFFLSMLLACSLSLPDFGHAQVGLPPVIDPSGRSGLPPPVERLPR